MTDPGQTPIQRYRLELAERGFMPDPAQEAAISALNGLYEAMLSESRLRRSWRHRLAAGLWNRRRAPLQGIYFWGGVGRGKTWLVDIFFDCLPFENKLRMHFHRFMQRVHEELKRLKDEVNPLQTVADRFADETLIICFDEFHVTDITDAMLLGNLLEALFERGITLVATSNEHPDELYRDGLQRDRFLPAIELIKRYTCVIRLDSGIDYRLRYLDSAEIYHYPHDEDGRRMLESGFQHLAPDTGSRGENIEIEGRSIPTVRCADGVVWFDFRDLCDSPRGPSDYIEIGRLFQTVLIADVPSMDDDAGDVAKRFMTMIDEFYDHNVKVIMTAATPVDGIYTGRRLAKPFRRTVSRLVEMQSHDYLARGHLSD